METNFLIGGTPLFFSLIFIFLLIFILFFHLYNSINSDLKKDVKKELSKLNESENRVIENVTVKNLKGEYKTIDVLILSIYGIFIINLMDQSGKIFVMNDKESWVVKSGRNFTHLRNPLISNKEKKQALFEFLGEEWEGKQYYSATCFSKNSTLKNYKNQKGIIKNPNKIIKYIENKRSRRLTLKEVDFLYRKILSSENNKKNL